MRIAITTDVWPPPVSPYLPARQALDCSGANAWNSPMSEREFNVLFPCAGSEPKGEVHPTAPQLLDRLSLQNRLDEIGRSD